MEKNTITDAENEEQLLKETPVEALKAPGTTQPLQGWIQRVATVAKATVRFSKLNH